MIRKGIISELKREFQLPIFGETMISKSTKSCFSVALYNVEQKNLLGNRKLHKIIFHIAYFPKNDLDVHEKLQWIAEDLYECLSFVEYEGESFAPISMKHEVKDDKVFFVVEYHLQMILKHQYETMGTLMLNGKKAVGFETNGKI